jgi:hypothetical protein
MNRTPDGARLHLHRAWVVFLKHVSRSLPAVLRPERQTNHRPKAYQ